MIPLVGAMAALMLVAMSSEIVPIAYHINLTVLAGILLGPWLSIITRAHRRRDARADRSRRRDRHRAEHARDRHRDGRGMGALPDVRQACSADEGLRPPLPRRPCSRCALSTTLLVGIVALGGSPAATRESGAFDPSTLSFSNPFAKRGRFANAIVRAPAEAEAPQSSSRWPLRADGLRAGLDRLGARGARHGADQSGSSRACGRGSCSTGRCRSRTRAPVGDEGVHR